MSKLGKTKLARIPHDYYPTERRAMRQLRRHLPRSFAVVDPCAGDGRMITWVEELGGRYAGVYDIDPQGAGIVRLDALTLSRRLQLLTTLCPLVVLSLPTSYLLVRGRFPHLGGAIVGSGHDAPAVG